MIEWIPDEYRIVLAGQSISLLPREYALLSFLYDHPGRTFSRDELLDRVWKREEPSDRTVDDHIYRLRKKLAHTGQLTIQTVRGQGYKLLIHSPSPSSVHPLLDQEPFLEGVRHLFKTYHGLGMGAAIRTLAANKEVLGLPADPFYDAYVHFVSGEFDWLLETDRLDFWQKTGYLLFIYGVMQFAPERSLYWYERLVAHGEKLPEAWQNDILLNSIAMYIEAGRFEEAAQMFHQVEPVIEKRNSVSFSAFLRLTEVRLRLLQGDPTGAGNALARCEELLNRSPLQREVGAFHSTKGLYLYYQQKRDDARRHLDKGMDITRETRFVPHLIHKLHISLFFLKHHIDDPLYLAKYADLWNEYQKQYRFSSLVTKTERLFAAHL